MSATNSPPDLPPPPQPSGQWAYPTNEQGEPKKKYVLWIVLGAAGCFAVIVVFGLLATILVPSVIRGLSRAQQAKAQQDIQRLTDALETYSGTHDGRYPASLEALVRPDEEGRQLLDEPELPRDPWDRAYHYEPPTAGRAWPDVYSLGHDGLPGGRGADEDIHSVRPASGKR